MIALARVDLPGWVAPAFSQCDDTGAADMATVIIAVMAAVPGSDANRYSCTACASDSGGRGRPHP
jgi:hypothetical protein